MGKSEKKGKKGTKKKKQSKKPQEDKMTFAEALLAYQIQMRESATEELLAELKQTEEKNTRYKRRNERLKAEQAGHIKELLSEAKAQEQELAKNKIVNREQVEEQMKDKWDFIRQKEHLLEELRSEITGLEKRMREAKSQRDYWLEYKNMGTQKHAKQIHLLQEEIKHIKENFTEMDEHFRKSLEVTKNTIDKETEKRLCVTREMATLDAVKHIDVESRKEIQENKWLKQEIAAYSKDVQDLEETVYKLEQDNLQLIAHLYNCRLQALKVSRNIFLTQVAGMDFPEVLDDTLAKRDVDVTCSSEGEDKRLSTTADQGLSKDGASRFPPDVHHLPLEDEKDFKEHFQLGSLELKRLSIEGQAKPLHKQTAETTTEQKEGPSNQEKLRWPVTARMIKTAFPP